MAIQITQDPINNFFDNLPRYALDLKQQDDTARFRDKQLSENIRQFNERQLQQQSQFAQTLGQRRSEFDETLTQRKKEFGDELLIVFKNYPLDMKCNENITRVFHKNACLIAQLSRCAGRYGRFWDYHDLAFSKQKQASDKNAIAWAKELGLKEEEINDCLNDKGLLEK